jgi:uncharacterized membrane protein
VGDFCAYLEKISTLNSELDIYLAGLLLCVAASNTIAYYLFLRIVQRYFNSALAEERKQMSIVFGVFSGVVIITMIVFLCIGKIGTIVPNVTTRWFLENGFAVFSDFPILLILYFHHVNYRPGKLAAQPNKAEPEV